MTVALFNIRDDTYNTMCNKAIQYLAEGECDCDCNYCPGRFVCTDPDFPPFTILKEFIEHNKKLSIEDDRFNTDVNKNNLKDNSQEDCDE